jgi:peptidoglycan-associated lipoprotein
MYKRRYISWILAVIFVSGLLMGSGCAKKTIVTPAASDEAGKMSGIQEESLGGAEGGRKGRSRRQISAKAQAYGPEGIAFESEDLYFEFDQYTLNAEAKGLLKKKAAFLQKHPEVQITIEGHCDERGSADYNLGLGQKRADSVKSFIIDLGIPGGRLASVSYGKEQPKDPGNDESAWAQNRRAHLVIGGVND